MQISDVKAWSVALILAILVHAGALFYWNGFIRPGINSDMKDPQTIRMSFSRIIVDVPVPEKKIREPVQQNKKRSEKPGIKKANVLARKVERVKKPTKQPGKNHNEERHDNLSDQDIQAEPPQQARRAQSREVQQAYLLRLVRHIEKFKFYPGAARRRGVEGYVSIRFVISQQGEVLSLELSSPQRILKQAAQEAIHSAVPLPLPDEAGLVNQQIQFKMHYALR